MKRLITITLPLYLSLALLGCGHDERQNTGANVAVSFATPPIENGMIRFNGPRQNYQINRTASSIQVIDLVGTDGSSDASKASKLIFSDMSINLTIAALAPTVSDAELDNLVELYIAFFNRLPDADGMAYWINELKSGKSIPQIAESFYSAGALFPELTGYSSTLSAADFVRIIYKNVLGRTGGTAPSPEEVQYWVNDLASGRQTKSTLIASMLASAKTFTGDANFGWVPALLSNKVKVGRYAALQQGVSYLSSNDNISRFGAIATLISSSDINQALAFFNVKDENFNLLALTPAEPQVVSAFSLNNGGGVYFTAPSNTGGLAILNYSITCSAGTEILSSVGSVSPISINNLTNGKSYSCQLFTNTAFGSSRASTNVVLNPATEVALGNFTGNIVLGSPTDTSIKANVFATSQSGTVSIRYGRNPGQYEKQTERVNLVPSTPIELTLSGLNADTRYYYRLDFQASNNIGSGPTIEYSFQSARSPGQAFTFALQGDSHPEREKTQFDGNLYTRTLQTAAADKPDFYLLLGDDFSVDTLDPKTINASKVTERYTIQRPYLGLIGASSPVFLVNGNHEQAARFNLNGTPENIAVWAQNARNSHYSQPAPDYFYSGNKEVVPFIGLLRNYYAWTWGDALFVVIDPYWASTVAVDNVFGGDPKRTNMWDVTHGDEQYLWLKETLEKSKSKYKFIFAHHVMGTGRGGIELAGLWEWGGKNTKGVSEFATQRPKWNLPIHQLMVANKVTIFFQGHDHIWVHQQLDGVTYQSLSEPADPNYALWNSDAYLTGERFPSTGYTRVRVAPTGVKVEYIRTYLPKDEGPGKVNGTPVFSYTIP
jgi:hypothetical protein